MNLKLRIAFLFSLFVFIILMTSAVAIFLLNENFRKEEFFVRVENEANEASQLFLKGRQTPSQIILEINEIASSSLPEETIYIFDSLYNILYNTPGNYKPQVSPKAFQLVKKNKEYHYANGKRWSRLPAYDDFAINPT